MEFTPHIKFFNALTVTDLYNILRLRSEVFVVEQNCIYQDIDNKDTKCYHLMLFKDNELAAYARLVPPGLSFNEMSIGRVLSNPKYRRTGAGRTLMKLAIEKSQQLFAGSAIKIGAQAYLLGFYSSFGFVPVSEPYDEDGIPHIDMIRKL